MRKRLAKKICKYQNRWWRHYEDAYVKYSRAQVRAAFHRIYYRPGGVLHCYMPRVSMIESQSLKDIRGTMYRSGLMLFAESDPLAFTELIKEVKVAVASAAGIPLKYLSVPPPRSSPDEQGT